MNNVFKNLEGYKTHTVGALTVAGGVLVLVYQFLRAYVWPDMPECPVDVETATTWVGGGAAIAALRRALYKENNPDPAAIDSPPNDPLADDGDLDELVAAKVVIDGLKRRGVDPAVMAAVLADLLKSPATENTT